MAPILNMALEDELSDILKKARTGQQRSVADVACASGLPEIELTELERGLAPRRRDQVLAVAQALGLRAEPLAQVSDGWTPHELPASLAHVEIVLGSIGGYEVKGYVIHDRGEAILIDTAYNPTAMLELLARRNLRLRAICLTHGHSDHAEGIERILKSGSVPVYLGPDDLDRFALPLAGVPVAIKDCVRRRGHPTRHGSRRDLDHRPGATKLVKRLRRPERWSSARPGCPSCDVEFHPSAPGLHPQPARPRARDPGGSSGGAPQRWRRGWPRSRWDRRPSDPCPRLHDRRQNRATAGSDGRRICDCLANRRRLWCRN